MLAPVKTQLSANLDMIIGARTFQIGLARSTVSSPRIDRGGSAIAGRASACCSRTLRWTVSS
jgi:hypothetical protein